MHVDPPQDVEKGGTYFADNHQVVELWERWRTLRNAGFRLFFHFAPPCSTFSRARDRSVRTRLRSATYPEGLYGDDRKTEEANEVAKNTALSIRFLVSQPGACGTLEQPASSYMMSYLDKVGLLDEHRELLLHQCRFGRPYRKPTAFWSLVILTSRHWP